MVFQPTHPCGVRLRRYLMIFVQQLTFQPTHPCGVRLIRFSSYGLSHAVSTHAPLRGATSDPFSTPPDSVCFNPRTPAGCDWRSPTTLWTSSVFQPTHPCGVRPFGWRGKTKTRRFNPRTPAGCDPKWLKTLAPTVMVSTHAPLRGATNRSLT